MLFKDYLLLTLAKVYFQKGVVSVFPFSVELRCIHGQSISQAMNSKKEEEEGNERTTFENVAREIIKQ